MTVAAVFILNPGGRLARMTLALALATLVPAMVPPPEALAFGAKGFQTEPADGSPPSPRLLMLAQAAAAPQAGPRSTQVAPGETLALPADVASEAHTTKNYVIVTKAPSWLTLQPAEKVGEGVWLVSPQNVADTKMTVAQGASGSRDVAFTIVDKDGAMVKEVVVSLGVAEAAGNAKAAVSGVAVAQAQPAQPAPAKPAAAVAPPAAAEPKPAAPAKAQAAEPAPGTGGQATAKTWTDFIAGRKPAEGAAAAKPADPAGGSGSKKSEAELITYAKHLVRECTTCHSLYGQDDGIPLMIGLTKDRFLDTMDLYRTGKRDNIAMQSVAQSLTDEDILALAIYLGRIKPPVQTASRGSSGSATPGGATDTTGALALRAPATALQPGSKDAERLDRWVKRAEKMLEGGEIAQARLLLQRATELGHAVAAMTLASSFDPNILPWRPEMGMEADPARAKQLYLHAIQLGAGAEAQRRLSELP